MQSFFFFFFQDFNNHRNQSSEQPLHLAENIFVCVALFVKEKKTLMLYWY